MTVRIVILCEDFSLFALLIRFLLPVAEVALHGRRSFVSVEGKLGADMDFIDVQKLAEDHYPRTNDTCINYGTAGFRTKADRLQHVLYRMGVLAAIRSAYKKATIGVMITASHNPEEDNGVKLVDPMGEMLEGSWETYATNLANVPDNQLSSVLKSLTTEISVADLSDNRVVIARDTRPSSLPLSQAAEAGIKAAGAHCQDFSLLTTPQLHYMVRCINSKGKYGTPTEQGYYDKLSDAFLKLKNYQKSKKIKTDATYKPFLILDAANGVGAPKVQILKKYVNDLLEIEVVNDGTKGKLNHECGADFVKVQQKPPTGLSLQPGQRCASFDGDADRIVYFYADADKTFHLLDGDKIATLVAGYLKNILEQTGLNLNLGLVQTAYANGSSTSYITEKLKVPVACVPTGVKHLHHRAQQFDIGVYFEANGHGTVLFSESTMQQVNKATSSSGFTEQQREACKHLATVIDLINQTVGDAISDMLLVESVLSSLDWDAEQWDKSYTDLPNRQLKVKVSDRSVIQTTDAERKASLPKGLQDAIDKRVQTYKNGRSFVRPSGTEDVVRVYSESDTQANADKLGYEVAEIVYELAGGIGEKPKLPC